MEIIWSSRISNKINGSQCTSFSSKYQLNIGVRYLYPACASWRCGRGHSLTLSASRSRCQTTHCFSLSLSLSLSLLLSPSLSFWKCWTPQTWSYEEVTSHLQTSWIPTLARQSEYLIFIVGFRWSSFSLLASCLQTDSTFILILMMSAIQSRGNEINIYYSTNK